MKSLVAVILALSLSNAWAQSAVQVVEPGLYTEFSPILLAWVQDRKTCKSEGGKWNKKEKSCVLSSSNKVEISLQDTNPGKSWLDVITIGANLHLCEFGAEATLQADGSWLAVVATEDYVTDPLTGGEVLKPTQCRVVVSSIKAASKGSPAEVKVESSGGCSEFCGANAHLEITRAVQGQRN